MFDIEKIKKESGLDQKTLKRIENSIRKEFKDDPMMFELHLLRTLKAIKAGWISLKEALT